MYSRYDFPSDPKYLQLKKYWNQKIYGTNSDIQTIN